MPRGELDATRAGVMRERIETALAAGKRRLIVDLAEVTYMETRALSALLEANARASSFGAAMLVVVPSDSHVRRVFGVARLDGVLRIVESRDAALRAA